MRQRPDDAPRARRRRRRVRPHRPAADPARRSASPSSAGPSRCRARSRPPPVRACASWPCRTTRPPRKPPSGTPPPRSNPTITDAEITVDLAAGCPTVTRRQPSVRLTISYPMPFLTGFFGSGLGPHRNGSHAMQRLTSLLRAPPRRASAAPPRSSSPCSWCRSSASPPSPSTSARSTPSAPGCRWPPTPPRWPSRRTAPAAPAATCWPPRQPGRANDGGGHRGRRVLSAAPL